MATNNNELAVVSASGCYVCGNPKDAIKPCVACGRSACKGHRGDKDDDYRTLGDKGGYACTACIEAGRVRRSSSFSPAIDTVEFYLRMHTLPAVMVQVDERIARVQRDMVEATVVKVSDQAERLVNRSLDKTADELDRQVKRLADTVDGRVDKLTGAITVVAEQVDGRIDKLTEAVDRLNVNAILLKVAIIIGLVNAVAIVFAVLITKYL